MKKKIFILIILLVFSILYLVIGNLIHIYIPCFIHQLTGLYCPGCGSTRMMFSILKFDFKAAFQYNQLLFILSPAILFLLIDYIYSWIVDKKCLVKKIPNYIWYILIVILLIYGILRNIYVPLQPVEL
jgi:hypothetical protein